MKKAFNYLILIFTVSFLAFSLGQKVNAQEATTGAKLTFPIAELGNCTSREACREYCSREENKTTCHEYSQSHGVGAFNRYNSMVQQAKRELGCNSVAECRRICSLAENKEKCARFGKKFEPKKVKDRREELLKRAQEILGCTTHEECKALCRQEENREKCRQLKGLPPKIMKIRPQDLLMRAKETLGCDTLIECREFCSKPENKEKCKILIQPK